MYSGTSLIGPSLGPKKFGPIKEVAILMRLESTPELYLGPTRGGHYNEVVLLQSLLLSKVSLYFISDNCLGEQPFLLAVTLFAKPDSSFS